MTFFYKILSVDDQRGSMIVRIWTDKLSEHDLRTAPIDREARDLYLYENAGKTANDFENLPEKQTYFDRVKSPSRCMTDYNLQIWNPDWSEEELHRYIQTNINTQWLELQEKIKDPDVDTKFETAKSLVGKQYTTTPRKIPQPEPTTTPSEITEI